MAPRRPQRVTRYRTERETRLWNNQASTMGTVLKTETRQVITGCLILLLPVRTFSTLPTDWKKHRCHCPNFLPAHPHCLHRIEPFNKLRKDRQIVELVNAGQLPMRSALIKYWERVTCQNIFPHNDLSTCCQWDTNNYAQWREEGFNIGNGAGLAPEIKWSTDIYFTPPPPFLLLQQ